MPGAKALRNPSGLLSPGVPALQAGVPLGPDLYERNPRHRFPSEICVEIRNAAYRPDCNAVSVVYPRRGVTRIMQSIHLPLPDIICISCGRPHVGDQIGRLPCFRSTRSVLCLSRNSFIDLRSSSRVSCGWITASM